MSTTRTLADARAFDAEWRDEELPPLTTIDRTALRLGLQLILWGQRHSERAERAEQARRSLAADAAAAAARDAFERRATSGPAW